MGCDCGSIVGCRDSVFHKIKNVISIKCYAFRRWVDSFKSIDYKSNYVKHAIEEFKCAGWIRDDDDMQKWVMGDILKLLTTLSRQGHSGGSIGYVLDHFRNLAEFGIIAPLEDIDDQWSDVSSFSNGEIKYQNKRLSSVFKDGKNGRSTYSNAISWHEVEKMDDTGNITKGSGCTYHGSAKTGSGKRIRSSQVIKFPFRPKTFYVDVIETSDGFIIKDESQLDEVFDYYSRTEN